ncbi:MAG TPA: D-alanyl-D-alanine carboxypeptidase family protein [Oceanospirillales bacterium]|nr:D-alanyl-D-alanine carboxypeptidase family protein [Oceanospirillales bacterium]
MSTIEHRISLQKRKNGGYWIRDILDGKKLGKIKHVDNKSQIIIKPQFNNKLLSVEAKYLLLGKTADWHEYYKQYLGKYDLACNASHKHLLPLFAEACRLKKSGNDMFKRPSLLHPAAKKAWRKMKQAALQDNIDLQLISAYRSLDYQKKLLESKLAKGISLTKLLSVNTLPGYSEHHTGCAIDIGSENAAILETEFEQSSAFHWLQTNARHFQFFMSYPRGNTTGLIYEPWHWCYKISS